MRIRVGGEKCHFVRMNLLFLLFLSVFPVGMPSAVDQPTGTVGVALGEISPDIKQAAGLHEVNGAVIQQALPDSAAARAGLQPGDLVIGVDGSGVDGPADVVQRVGRHSSGESVSLVILRPDGQGHVQQYQVNLVLQPAVAGFTPGQQVSHPSMFLLRGPNYSPDRRILIHIGGDGQDSI